MNDTDATVGTVTTALKTSGYKEMGLSECAKFDAETGQRDKLTGWGRICKERAAKHQSKRGERRRARKG